MNSEQLAAVEKALKGTRETMLDVCRNLGIGLPDEDAVAKLYVSQCSMCSIWGMKRLMLQDLDGFEVCSVCDDVETIRF